MEYLQLLKLITVISIFKSLYFEAKGKSLENSDGGVKKWGLEAKVINGEIDVN